MAEKTPTGKKSRDYERRHATVMFADISGFTAMSEKVGPEQVTELINQCFEMMAPVIKRYEGTIDKFMGDSVMVLFGVPAATENAPTKAVNAAIELRSALSRFTEEKGLAVPINLHIGINTGEVLAGTVGGGAKKEYTVMGDAVNLASRLDEISTAGQILVGPDTYWETKDDFEYRELSAVTLKGKEKMIPVWELMSVTGRVHRPSISGTDRMVYSAMVGRDAEMGKLEHSVMKAVNGEGQIVNIIGEAGIGKSRLKAELKGREVMERTTIVEGRAISMGKNLPFHPIIDLIKNWVGITEDDDGAVALAKLERSVRGVYQEEAGEIVPFVATLMGMKLTGRWAERVRDIEGEALEKLIYKNVRELVVKVTERRPLVIIMEDLHWADTSSLELLESLMRLVEKQRVLFINLFRPNFPDTSDRIVETVRERHFARYTEIGLSPLGEPESEVLVNNLLRIKGLPREVRERIIKRAGGNPFFIEEVVRSLIDEGAVVRRNGDFIVTKGINEFDIPPTINDLLMARIDRLDEETRELVKTASVIGRSFFYRVLAELTGEEQDIDARLTYLTEIQLILKRMRLEELEYLFKHALAQEAAYGSLPHSRQRELHLAVARSFEKVFREKLHDFYGMLAFHYMRGEDEEKSYEYLVKAGEEAMKSSASSEALNYYREALNLYLNRYGKKANPEKVAMLEKNIALSLFNWGQYPDAIEHFDRVLSYYGYRPPRNPIALTFKFSLDLLIIFISLYVPTLKWKAIPTKRDNEILNLWTKRSTCLVSTDAKRLVIESFIYGATRLTNLDLRKVENGVGIVASSSCIFSYSGISFAVSRKILEFVSDKFDKNDVKTLLVYNYSKLVYRFFVGEWGSIEKYDNRLITRNLSMGEIYFPYVYTTYHARLKIQLGLFREAQWSIDKLSEIADMYEHDSARADMLGLRIEFSLRRRKFIYAMDEIEEGITFSRKVGLKMLESYYYTLKARTEFFMRDRAACERTLSLAGEHIKLIKRVPYHHSSFLLAHFVLNLHLLEKSIGEGNKSWPSTLHTRTLKLGKRLVRVTKKNAVDRTEAYRLMGTYWWLVGKEKKAVVWWERSIKEGERLGARPELSRTYFEVGKRLSEKDSKYRELNGVIAREYLEKARQMFIEMDLQWDLDELEKIQ